MTSVIAAAAIAVLPFAAGDNGMPYAILPTPAQRAGLADRLAVDLRRGGVRVVRGGVSCDDALCARRAGAALGARTVVYGTATRYMALIWGASTDVVDVRSGRVQGPYSVGYKGDYDSLRNGIDDLAAALVPRLSAPARTPRARSAKSAAVGRRAPPFVVDALDGRELTLDAFRGRPLIINVFASWCGPCREELPRFVRAHARHGSRVAFLGIDEQESPTVARAFARSMRLAFPVAVDEGPMMAAYGAASIPETIVIDAHGIVREIDRGPMSEAALERALALARAPARAG
jgi:cytochrome c biogenesis protein CcmG/thiol:disulfide interchange protein DsbE